MPPTALKKKLKMELESPSWQESLPEIAALGQKACPGLFSLLLSAPETRHRAAAALGLAIADIAEKNPEKGRDYIRQFMWRMNEDSGNIGWGVPEAFAETLAASPMLAREFAHILISYIIDLGFADNFCDYAPLRRSCYWAVGRLAEANPLLAAPAGKWLLKGLEDEDEICRGMAAWALGKLPPVPEEAAELEKLTHSPSSALCEIFENGALREVSISGAAKETLAKLAPDSASK